MAEQYPTWMQRPNPSLRPASEILNANTLGALAYGANPLNFARDIIGNPLQQFSQNPGLPPIVAGPADFLGSALSAPANLQDRALLSIQSLFEPQGGNEVDAISSAAPIVSMPGQQEPTTPPAPQPLFNLGPQMQLPQVPQLPGTDYSRFGQALMGARPQAPDMSLLANPPQRPAPIQPDLGPSENALETLRGAAPEEPTERPTLDKAAMILSALAAGAARGDGSLRDTLAYAGPQIARLAIGLADEKAQQSKEYQQAKIQHDLAISNAEQELANIRTSYEQAAQNVDSSNAETMYNAQLAQRQAMEQFQQREQDWALDIARLEMQAEQARAEQTSRQLMMQFDRDFSQAKLDYERNAPKVDFKDGNFVVQRVTPEGDVFIETVPVGTGANLKELTALGNNENLPPLFRQQINSQVAFLGAMQTGDPTMLYSVVADDLLEQPGALEGFEDEMQNAADAAAQMQIFPGSAEYNQFVRRYLTQQIMPSLFDPAELAKAAEISPMAAKLQELTRANYVQK